MKKAALFAFRGDMACFIHVMLNAIDLNEKGYEVKVVFEGESVTLVEKLADAKSAMHGLFEKTRSLGLVAGVCKACATNLGALDAARRENLPLLDDMHGHPSMGRYLDEGYQVITF